MAKNPFDMKASGGALRKLIGVAVAVALVVLVVKYPTDSAAWARHVGGMGGGAVDALVTFFRSLGS